MPGYMMTLVFSGVAAFVFLALAHFADVSLEKVEAREYEERVGEGLTVERAIYFARAAQRRTVFSNAMFWIGVIFVTIFVATVGIGLMPWP